MDLSNKQDNFGLRTYPAYYKSKSGNSQSHISVRRTWRKRAADLPVLVDIAGRDGSQVGVGLVLTYGPDIDEVPALKGGLAGPIQ